MLNLNITSLKAELGSFLILIIFHLIAVTCYFSFVWSDVFDLHTLQVASIIFFTSMSSAILVRMFSDVLNALIQSKQNYEGNEKLPSLDREVGIATDTLILSAVYYLILSLLVCIIN